MSGWRPQHRRTLSLPLSEEQLKQCSMESDGPTDTTSLCCDVDASFEAEMGEHEEVRTFHELVCPPPPRCILLATPTQIVFAKLRLHD